MVTSVHANTDMSSTNGPNTESLLENSERESPLKLHSPSSTRLSTWTTTVPAFLSPPPMRELTCSEKLPLHTENTSSGDTAPTNQSDARTPTDTKSVLPMKVRSIPPISSSSTEFTPGKMEHASKSEDPKLKFTSSNQKPLPTDGISIEEDATNQACTAKTGETCTSACGTKTENGVVKSASTPSRMDTASNSMEPPSEMDKLMKPLLESSLPEESNFTKDAAKPPVSMTESGTKKPTVSGFPFGPTESEI